MQVDLVRKLVEGGVIRQNTEVEAYHSAIDMAGCPFTRTVGSFLVNSVAVREGEAVLKVRSKAGEQKTIPAADVVRIDGMEVGRLAGIFGLDLAGGKLKQGKRRGRKPKNRAIEATA